MNASRRQSRELALQTLFHIDLGKAEPLVALREAFEREPLEGEGREYTRALVKGVTEHLDELDRIIAALAKDWKPERMANVDRNVLRLALYEVLHQPSVPDSVAINEAVELVKAYSTEESHRFVNGILGTVARLREAGEPLPTAPDNLSEAVAAAVAEAAEEAGIGKETPEGDKAP